MTMNTASSRLGRHAAALSDDECWTRVAATALGRVVFDDNAGRPTLRPVNHAVDRAVTSGTASVVFRTVAGTKLAAAAAQRQVCFEVDGFDEQAQTGWSVLIHGRASLVTDHRALTALYGTRLLPWGPESPTETVWVRITPHDISGLELTSSSA